MRHLPVGLNNLGSPYMVVNTNVWFVPYDKRDEKLNIAEGQGATFIWAKDRVPNTENQRDNFIEHKHMCAYTCTHQQ